jgi:hypothetical protein
MKRPVPVTLQWLDSGCENCRWSDTSEMEPLDRTTTNFSGYSHRSRSSSEGSSEGSSSTITC